MERILLELITRMSGEVLVEMTLLFLGTYIVWRLMPVVRQGIEDAAPLPGFIRFVMVGIGIVFAFVLPVALVIWLVSILFRYP